jgi:hypothetical protein
MRFTSTIWASKAKLLLKSRICTNKIDSVIEELKEVIKKAETKINNEIETIKEAAKVPKNILMVTGMLIKTETK